jgi:putative resolvase
MVISCATVYDTIMERKMVSIHEAAEFLGVSAQTLRRWEREGKLMADERTPGGRRRYNLARLRPEQFHAPDSERRTIAYARASSHDQQNDLERQKQVLELYCARQGWTFEVVTDIGSGMNDHKTGLKRLLNDILADRVGRLVITHKDRLLRFGAELVFAICEAKHVEIVILNQGEDPIFEEELAQDVLEMITVFSARLYGSRSRKHQPLLDGVRHTEEEASS